jgi:hypothetical protein
MKMIKMHTRYKFWTFIVYIIDIFNKIIDMLLLNVDVDDDEGADWFICRDSEWFWLIEPGI